MSRSSRLDKRAHLCILFEIRDKVQAPLTGAIKISVSSKSWHPRVSKGATAWYKVGVPSTSGSVNAI